MNSLRRVCYAGNGGRSFKPMGRKALAGSIPVRVTFLQGNGVLIGPRGVWFTSNKRTSGGVALSPRICRPGSLPPAEQGHLGNRQQQCPNRIRTWLTTRTTGAVSCRPHKFCNRGCSSMVELRLPKPTMRVRSPSPARLYSSTDRAAAF